jgi:hypothetical protein
MTVYFVKRGETVKIGLTSRDVRKRLAELRPGILIGHMPGGIALEAALHHQFQPLRLKGEWFQYAGKLRAFVEDGLDLPYGLFDENSDFLGLLGRGFERSFYRAYVRSDDSCPWWRFEMQAWPSSYDPIERQRQVRGPAETVRCHLRGAAEYLGKPDNLALLRLLNCAATFAKWKPIRGGDTCVAGAHVLPSQVVENRL